MTDKSPEDLKKKTKVALAYLQNNKKDTTVMEAAMMTAGVYSKDYLQQKKDARK